MAELTKKQKRFCQDIKGYEGLYKINEFGEILTVNTGKVRKGSLSKNGYVIITLSKNKKQKSYYIHRLVALTFINNTESKTCVNHKDGNKQNNNVLNLEWCTYKENMRHALDNNIDGVKGVKNGSAKLTEQDVKNIRKKHETGKYYYYQLAEEYKVSNSQIWNVVNGISFKDVI